METLIMFFAQLNATIFQVTLCFIAMDVITGYAQALANKNVSSKKMRNGFWHKLAIIFALMVAGMIDIIVQMGIGQQLGFATPIFELVCIYIIAMELTSILENICKMNPELANNKIMGLFSNTLPETSRTGTIEPDGAAPMD